jgi:hypothetical protein
MANKKEISKKEIVAQHFEANKEDKEVFVTSDNFIFLQYKHALDHANSLEESARKVETFKNAMHLEVETEPEA